MYRSNVFLLKVSPVILNQDDQARLLARCWRRRKALLNKYCLVYQQTAGDSKMKWCSKTQIFKQFRSINDGADLIFQEYEIISFVILYGEISNSAEVGGYWLERLQQSKLSSMPSIEWNFSVNFLAYQSVRHGKHTKLCKKTQVWVQWDECRGLLEHEQKLCPDWF